MASSISRLASLPSVFTPSDVLLRAGVPKAQLNQLLWRWKSAGHVQALGERADVWFNLVVDPEITPARRERALRLALPQAVMAGHGVLMRSSLTTQMSTVDYFIRPARSAVAKIDGIELHERPISWMKILENMGAVTAESGLPELDPGAALADLLRFDPDGIDLEEIDFTEMSEQSKELFEALRPDPAETETGERQPAQRG